MNPKVLLSEPTVSVPTDVRAGVGTVTGFGSLSGRTRTLTYEGDKGIDAPSYDLRPLVQRTLLWREVREGGRREGVRKLGHTSKTKLVLNMVRVEDK